VAKSNTIVSEGEWLKARKKLLAKEKRFLKLQDALRAEQRALPRVRVTKPYLFQGPEGKVSLLKLESWTRVLDRRPDNVYALAINSRNRTVKAVHERPRVGWSSYCPARVAIARPLSPVDTPVVLRERQQDLVVAGHDAERRWALTPLMVDRYLHTSFLGSGR
jgi:hypothetical protein